MSTSIKSKSEFHQPTISADGVLGGNTFAVSASTYGTAESYAAWRAWDGNTTAWLSGKGAPFSMIFYNPVPLNVTAISVKNYTSEGWRSSVRGYVQGSNDNIHWTNLTSYTNAITTNDKIWTIYMLNNVEAFYYHKIVSEEVDITGTNYAWGVEEFTLTAYTYDDGLPITALNTVKIADAPHTYVIRY